MNTPINLNKARKARAKAEKQARASENIVKHGRSKAAQQSDEQSETARVTRLDAHKRDT